MRKIGLMQDVPNRARREAQTDAATAAIASAEAERRVLVLTVRRKAALAWLDRYYLERQGALFDELDRENQLFGESVRAQISSGRGMAADIVAPEQEAADIADRRDELSAQIARSRAALKRWVGTAADESLSGDPPPMPIDVDELRQHVHEHPELAVFVPMVQQAQAEVHEAEAEKRPDWGVELAYSNRAAPFSDMVTLEFTWNLPIFSRTRQDPQIAARRQELDRIEMQRDAMLRDHTEELEAAVAEYDVAARQLARLRDAHLPLARQKVDYLLADYRAGKSDLSPLLTARRELIDVRLKEIELQAKRASTAAKLYYFYGPGAGNSTDTPETQDGAATPRTVTGGQP
jgi:outer membrane protein TolC